MATGLALTIALALALLGGLILAGFAYLMRTNSQLVDIDASVAQWGADHAGPSRNGGSAGSRISETRRW